MEIRHIEIRNFRGIHNLAWHIKGDFQCIIGPGDTCKTTILTALDYALSPRQSLSFDDADFYNQNIENDIVIQITLVGWDQSKEEVKDFFKESKYGQLKCGITPDGPIPEPDIEEAVSISLRVDKSLEPKWSIVKGRDIDDTVEKKAIYASDRAILGISRIDVSSDIHFTWSRNTILTRLSKGTQGNINEVLSELGRATRQSDISAHQSVVECQIIAGKIQEEAKKIGVKLSELSPKIDIQKQSINAGALSLHENNVPLRSKGSGSKKLISCAMQMKLHDGKNIALIDEIETGLEPHRIRGLIYTLRNSEQQIFTTTHSSVVIRELKVADDELYVCKRDNNGTVSLKSLSTIPEIQASIRSNAEAFLGSKIIACEGATEIGCLRAYDQYRFDENNIPIWSLATAYFNCSGGGKIKIVCPKIVEIGYKNAVLCDNDAQDQLNDVEVTNLQALGIHICQWEKPNSTEHQLFKELPWNHIATLLSRIADNHDTLEFSTIINLIKTDAALFEQNLDDDPTLWNDSPVLRKTMGDITKKRDWIKRIDYAEKIFEFAFPLLPETSIIKLKLKALWDWVQND